MKNLKKILVYAGIVLLFIIIAYAYVPQVLSGKIVNQADIAGWTGMAQELIEHNQAHPDDKTLWTNSMFGGMPTVSIHADFEGDWTKPVYDFLLLGARPATYLFISLLGGFLLMLAFGVSKGLAIAGAIAITFCSYNMQIIQVGHNTKMQAIAFMPWVLAAMVFTYRSVKDGKNYVLKSLFGSVLFAFALSFQIKANHPQITYYLAIIIAIYVIGLFISILTHKEGRKIALGKFFLASAFLLVVGCVGIATNLNKLIPTYEYAEYTMRGGSELSGDGTSDSGLELDYATAWSYGIEETPNLLIPNFNGGSSAGATGLKNSAVEELLRQAGQPHLDEVLKGLPLYWGPQPFTAGPMYMGAVTVFLFVLGLCLVRGREKWWIAVATLLAVLLAWGSHFMWFTKLWYDFAPLYNKFRTVSMALVVLQITLPVLGILVVDRIVKGEVKRPKRGLGIAYAIVGGFCLIFACAGSLAGSFAGATDAQLPDILADAIRSDRRAMLSADALRSFIFVTMAAGVIFWQISGKPAEALGGVSVATDKKGLITTACLCLLMLMDLIPVDKRYLNDEHFVSRRNFDRQFAESPVDEMIKEDPALYYRVVDLRAGTFNDSHASYRHKSIGGYSPAKLQRYQDLIDYYLAPEINSVIGAVNSHSTISEISASLPSIPVISMLNGKYFIVGDEYMPVVNEGAYGNCWIVSEAVAAASPDEEIALLGGCDLRSETIIGADFAWARERLDSLSKRARVDIAPADSVWLTSYAPNELRYQSRLHGEEAVVFSEIYYPKGWHLTVDGQPAELFRANWILRGAFIPAGEHEIVMRFDPQSFKTGATLSRISSILLILLLLGCGGALAKRTGVRAASR